MTGTRCSTGGDSTSTFCSGRTPSTSCSAPTLIYKGIQATIGMERLLPYAVVSTASFLASVVLLFVYLRRRVGEWLALAGVLPVLFMGTAWEVLLLAVRGLVHRLDGRWDRRAAGAGARTVTRRCAGLRPPRRLAGLLRARPLVRPGRGGLDDPGAAPLVSRLRRRRPARPLRGVVRRLGTHGREPARSTTWCTARCTWSKGSPPACGRCSECPLNHRRRAGSVLPAARAEPPWQF